MSTSSLFRGISGFEAPGAGLAVLDGGAEWVRGGGAVEVDGPRFEMIELMRSDGFGVGRPEDNGGDTGDWYGRVLADEEVAGLLDSCREGGAFNERGGEEDEAWGRC